MTPEMRPLAAAGDKTEECLLYADKHLRITWSITDSSIVLYGEVDASNSASLARALAVAGCGGQEIVVDTRDLRFIDLSGLRALLTPGHADRPVRLRNVPPNLRRLLDVLGSA